MHIFHTMKHQSDDVPDYRSSRLAARANKRLGFWDLGWVMFYVLVLLKLGYILMDYYSQQ